MNAVTSLIKYKLQRTRVAQRKAFVVRKYKQEITDWCGHDLACQVVAERLNISERLVRNIVAEAGNIW